MIYVAEIQNGKLFKIGFTDENIERRLAQLQTGNPYAIKLMFAVNGTLSQERAIHDALTSLYGRIHMPCPANEWYSGMKHPIVRRFLDELKISVSGAIGFADNWCGDCKWMGGVLPSNKVNARKAVKGNLAMLRWPQK
jgi:T5orf172 domain